MIETNFSEYNQWLTNEYIELKLSIKPKIISCIWSFIYLFWLWFM